MKALSLIQPWATLVTIGAKRIETRDWATAHLGLIAIHASKREDGLHLARVQPFSDCLAGLKLPRGAILCVVDLWKIEQITPYTELPPDPEYQFGDYTPGRFMWHVHTVYKFPEPIQSRGALGLWEANIESFLPDEKEQT